MCDRLDKGGSHEEELVEIYYVGRSYKILRKIICEAIVIEKMTVLQEGTKCLDLA